MLRLEERFVPFLEREGFRYSKSQIKFSRKRDDVAQEVVFSLNRYNSEDDCNFWTTWTVRSLRYSKWYQAEWGEKPANDALGGCADWNIPGWDRGGVHNFNLTNSPSDLGEIERLIRNVRQSGLPYLGRISSWQGAAAELQSRNHSYAKAADFLLIAGENQRAEEVLLRGLQRFEIEGMADQLEELPEIKKRLQRYY